MKFSKQAILARVHKIPSIRFEDQQLTSFGGAIVFQMLFQRLHLKARLKHCFQPVKGSAVFGADFGENYHGFRSKITTHSERSDAGCLIIVKW